MMTMSIAFSEISRDDAVCSNRANGVEAIMDCFSCLAARAAAIASAGGCNRLQDASYGLAVSGVKQPTLQCSAPRLPSATRPGLNSGNAWTQGSEATSCP